MKDSFEECLAFTLKQEGDYSNDPKDPGGETKWGISRRAHPSISDADWANFRLSDAKAIYRRDYYDACNCGNLRYGYDLLAFDTAVLCGVSVAKKLLDEAEDPWDFIFRRIRLHVENKGGFARFGRGWVRRCLDLYDHLKEKGVI